MLVTSFLSVGATEVHIPCITLKGGYRIWFFSPKAIVVREKSENEQ